TILVTIGKGKQIEDVSQGWITLDFSALDRRPITKGALQLCREKLARRFYIRGVFGCRNRDQKVPGALQQVSTVPVRTQLKEIPPDRLQETCRRLRAEIHLQ